MGDVIDPTLPPRGLSRGAFVALSAAMSSGTVAASAVARAAELGKPHTPLVPENDPAIKTESTALARPNTDLPAYVAVPAYTDSSTPSVVVIMHIWGVDSQIRDTVRRLAKAGYAAIAPYLYHRFGNDPSDNDGDSNIDTYRPFSKQLDRKVYDGDIRAAALYLRKRFPKTKTGIMGFCMGGHIVLQQAVDNDDLFAVAAPFYGAVKDIDPLEVKVPIFGSYGERDKSIPAGDVRLWMQRLRVTNDVKVYPTAGHAFFDDTRSSYVPSAADDAWQRTLSAFAHFLGPSM